MLSWEMLRNNIERCVNACPVCAQTQTPQHLPTGILQPLPKPQSPWFHITIDFISDWPSFQGHTTILTIVHWFTNACQLVPLTKQPTAIETAEILKSLLEDNVFDWGIQFTSQVWQGFCKRLNINVSLPSGYHPQTNGQRLERLNQKIGRFLWAFCYNNQHEWSRYLPWAKYEQNSFIHSTGLTHFSVWHREHPGHTPPECTSACNKPPNANLWLGWTDLVGLSTWDLR